MTKKNWAKGLNRDFSKDVQIVKQAYESMHNIIWEFASRTCKLKEKKKQWDTTTHQLEQLEFGTLPIPSAGEDAEQQEWSVIAGSNSKWYSCFGRHFYRVGQNRCQHLGGVNGPGSWWNFPPTHQAHTLHLQKQFPIWQRAVFALG